MLLILTTLTGDYVAMEAMKYVGVSYRYGGMDFGGMDCSGLVNTVYSRFGVRLPRRSRDIARAGVEVHPDSMLPGDILAFSSRPGGPVNHVGIYVGKGKFVHASSSRGVVVDSLDEYYSRRLVTVRRFSPSKEYYFSSIMERIKLSALKSWVETDLQLNQR